MSSPAIPGDTFGTTEVTKSPVTVAEFDLFKQTVLLSAEDLNYLRLAGTVLEDQTEAVLDVWHIFVGSQPHRAYYLSSPDGQLDSAYPAAVRHHFGQWNLHTCKACYDQVWFDYQQEIALRHIPTEKNQTDKVSSAPDHIPLRYLIEFIYPITATVKLFLSKKGQSAGEVDTMFQAWFNAVVGPVSLWRPPYAQAGVF